MCVYQHMGRYTYALGMLTLTSNLFLLFTANTLFREEMRKLTVVCSGPVRLVCFLFDVPFDHVYEIRHRLHQGKCKLELKEHIKGVEFAFGSVFSYTHFCSDWVCCGSDWF